MSAEAYFRLHELCSHPKVLSLLLLTGLSCMLGR